ncbi:hypothetical protein Z946_2289 [Sulfitobacter noctilucicola]|nr:hypothetical protein Z946_2289 [Sulfitobacter noctilucicola]
MVEARARKWSGLGVLFCVWSAQMPQMSTDASAGPPGTGVLTSGVSGVSQRGQFIAMV